MALSFEESKKQLSQQAATPMMMSLARDTVVIENWRKPENAYLYDYYDNEYSDDKITTVDDNKNIHLGEGQINLTQEKNSQYIPFELPRYYDGFDLSKTELAIFWVNTNEDGSFAIPVDVYYSDDKIRFAWLIDENVTAVAGNIKFEIQASGTNSKGYDYLWKTMCNAGINVIQALEMKQFIKPDDTWQESFFQKIANEANKAEQASTDALGYAQDAQNAISDVEAIKNETIAIRDALLDNLDSEVASSMSVVLADYALHTYVDDAAKSVSDKIPTKLSQLENDNNFITTQTAQAYVDEKAKEVTDSIPTKVSELENDSGYITEHQSLDDYATKQDVTDAIAAADLDNYYKKTETYSRDEVNELLDDVDLSDYYTKTEVENKINEKLDGVELTDYATIDSLNAVSASVETVRSNTVTNATNISTVQNDIALIKSSLSKLEGDNKNLIIQYDEVGSILHLYEKDEDGDIVITDGDEQIKVKEISSTIITGTGGGGSALVSTIKLGLSPDGEDSSTVLYGNPTSLNYNLSTRKAKESQDENGNDVTIYEEAVIAGDITLTLYRNNVYLTHFTVTKNSSEVQNGSVDISDYVTLGNQVFTIIASYVEQLGSDGETITVRSPSADWAINAVNLKLTNLPDSEWEATPKYSGTTFSYTPIGDLEKTIYFKIDEQEPDTVVTKLNGTTLTYIIPHQTHGVHMLQVWCEGNVGGSVISTEPSKYVLMFVEDGNNTPIIRIKAPTILEQYSSAYIYYNVFDPLNGIIDSVIGYDEDGTTLFSVENITSAERKWEFKPSVVKNKTITIQYKEMTESVTIEVTKFPYEINAITGDLMLDFVPTGRTNSDVDYNVFKNNAYIVEKDNVTGAEIQKEIPMTWTLSDNFDWINGGWKTDENGDTYFCIKSGTSVDINYNLFGTDGVVAKKDVNGDYNIAGTGKEFKLVFKTTNVAQANATWLECVDIADKKSLGLRMESQNAYIDSGLGTLEIPYADDDIIEFDMNIIPMTKFLENGEPNLTVKAIPMIITYEDGTPVQPKVISSPATSFKQDTPKPITIGSKYCDVHIYRMKVYERYLEDKEIITNFIADARSGVEMAKRYVRNDIYPIENKQKITPESVAAACPDLKVYVLSAPHFTNDKGDKVANTTIKQIHNTGTKEKPEYDINENWIATGATHNGQGTSSNEYGYSGRNLEFNMKKATITLNDNKTVVKEIQLSPTSYPTNYLNFKINIASSENANNALLQKRYDRYLPYTSVASLIDNRKKNSMEFYNCVVFIQETDEDISTHREFSDTDIHFYGIGNIGDSKKTDDTRVNDKNDVNEFCVEIMDWNRHLSSFPIDTMVSTLYIDDDGTQVLRFEDFLVDTNLGEDGIIYERDGQGNYYHSTDVTVDKTKTYYIDILENDDFSEDYTYGFRYLQQEWKKDDDPNYKALNEEFQRPLRQKWIEFYRFVTSDLTTNGVEDFEKVEAWKSEFSNWFVLDAALYYYLYTLRYTMVDNRAKNTFWHWGKHYLTFEEAIARGISVYDADKNLITDSSNLPSKFYDINGNEIKNINAAAAAINDGYRMDFWDYDNDTALGIDNAGKLEIPVGVEEDDVDFAGVPYFRAHDSLVFARIAKYFVDELEDAWHNTEINPVGKVFDSTSFINEFDSWQNEFPEELWRLDYERKYKRTYVGGTGNDWDNALPQSNQSDIVSTRFLTEMMNGRKKYQRRCFERNQEIYMSSKFKGEVNINDTITLRGTGKPTGKVVPPNFTLNIIPFSKMYVNLYSATDKIYYHKKCEAGVPCDPIPYPETTLDFIYIRGASQIQSLGDLSPMYLQTAELPAGAKLKTITLGNKTDGYDNDSLKTLQIGAGNKLLEELDIRNLDSFNNTALPASNIPSLKRVYAQGSNISEAVFANNGLLEEAYLPKTITRLELRNLHYLKTISLELNEDGKYNLLHLVALNCSDMMNTIVLDMVNKTPDLATLRATNINWELSDTTVLEKLYGLIKNTDAPEVVLTGKVHVALIREQQLYNYQQVWPDLEITFNTMVEQYPVFFKNYDGTILEIQYVDKGKAATDPVVLGRIPTPTKESSISTDYTYAGWDVSLEDIFSERVITAIYTGTTRTYTIKYVSKGITMQESTGLYGDYIEYTGVTPTYTLEESGYTYHLFRDWDKSGYVDGNKTINAIFDTFEFNKETSYVGEELSTLSDVAIYALTKIGVENTKMGLEDGDPYAIRLGYDIKYNDIDSKVIVEDTVSFNGGNYIDTGIDLFRKDRDFTLAIDYEFLSGTASNSVIVQCFQSNGSSGFKLWYNNGVKFNWCTTATTSVPGYLGYRDMMVIRHKAGESTLNVYMSNLNASTTISLESLDTTKNTIIDSTLVLGCAKADDGAYEGHAIGNVHWCKVWYKDLGDSVCRKLANWTHEKIAFEMCGQKRFYLTNDSTKRCTLSLLATHLLERNRKYNNTRTNTGGWTNSDLNKFLNSRLYDAMPSNIKTLIKQVTVQSSVGDMLKDITKSECYITIPSVIEVSSNSSYNKDPYVGEMAITDGKTISYLKSNDDRKRAYDGGDYYEYWLRSPNIDYNRYVFTVDNTGYVDGYEYPDYTRGVLIEISF